MGSPENAGIDQNRHKGLLVRDYSDPTQNVALVADPATKRLLVNATGLITTSPEETDTATTTTITVGVASTSVLAANADRIAVSLINDSDQIIYITLGATASMNSGIRLNANGGSAEITQYTGAISAICTSASKRLIVTEL